MLGRARTHAKEHPNDATGHSNSMREGSTGKATAVRTVCLLARRRLKMGLERERRAGQAETLFEGRLLQLSKASAPFVELTEF
jgi:hypothetical protein